MLFVRRVALAVLLAAGCTRLQPRETVELPGQTVVDVSGPATPKVADGFDPGAPLEEPPMADSRAPGAALIARVADPLQSRWSTFLEDLRLRMPPHHPLNNPQLAARIGFAIDRDGRVSAVAVLQSSGEAELDEAAVAIVREAAPLPRPEPGDLGDDDFARFAWLFARDRRQAGPATARIEPVRWPPERAVPVLIGRGQIAEAARRVAGPGLEPVARRGLLDAIARAQILGALEVSDPKLAAAGIAAARRHKLAGARRTLETLAAKGATRPAALAALAELGQGAGVGVATAALTSERSTSELLEAAASLLMGAGKGAVVADLAARSLASEEPEVRSRGLILAGQVAVPVAAERILELADQRPGAASAALARLAAAGDRLAMTALIAGLVGASAGARVAAARAAPLAKTSPGGAASRRRSRATIVTPTLSRALLARLGDRDERVRAAAVRSVAALAPTRLPPLGSESSPLVLTALAESLAAIPGRASTRRLDTLARNAQAAVRAAAAAALRGRAGAGRRGTKLLGDPDVRVRAAAMWAAPEQALRAMVETGPLRLAAALELVRRDVEPRWVASQLSAATGTEAVAYASAWLERKSRAKLK